MKINDIKIGSRFCKGLENIQALANSIQDIGLLQPPVVNENNELIADQRRIEACKLLDWTEIPAIVVNLDDIIKGEFYENAVRKDFTASERVAILESIEARRIGHRLANGNGNEDGKGVNLTPFQNEHKGEKSREIAARYTGIKPVQLQMEKKVVQAARNNPSSWGQLLEKVDNGKVKLHKAYNKILRESVVDIIIKYLGRNM